MFCTDSANIFINPPPACREMEKGGEGERDSDSERVSPGAHSPRLPAVPAHWTGGVVPGRAPPPLTPLPLLDSLRLQQQISRMASNSGVVSMTADIGQQQWLLMFFQFFIRTPISRVRDCYGSADNSEISGGRQVFGLRQIFDHFNHGGPVQYRRRVRP